MLAVATGVFALDGDWSLSGKAEIGAYADLDVKPAVIVGSAYNKPYSDYDNIGGSLSLGYNWDALKLGIGFNWNGGVGGELVYDGGSYKFEASGNLLPRVAWQEWVKGPYNWDGRLWGYYKLVNDLVHLEAAYMSRQNEWWASDKVASGGPIAEYPWDGGDTFAAFDHHTFLLAGVDLSNLSFGIVLPFLFGDTNEENFIKVPGSAGAGDFQGGKTNLAALGGKGFEFVDGVLKQAIAGFKFNMQPIEVAAQFRMSDYGVYFGGKWFIGSVTAGLSFQGILDPDQPRRVRFGGGVEYNPGVFGANINGWYGLQKNDAGGRKTQIGIEPGFFYNVIPTHLRFQTDVGFYFNGGRDTDTSEKKDLEIAWAVQPQLFWNFLGTGAGSYYGFNTGMIVRYRIVSKDGYDNFSNCNALDVTFRWAF